MSEYVYRVVSDGPMPDWWQDNTPHDTPEYEAWEQHCRQQGWIGWHPDYHSRLDTDGNPDPWICPAPTALLRRRRYLVNGAPHRKAELMSRMGWPSRVERGVISWETDDAW